jgi:hypothetical protein
MSSDPGGGIIIIRRKLTEQALPSVAPKVKVWHVLAAVSLVAFIAGALIF